MQHQVADDMGNGVTNAGYLFQPVQSLARQQRGGRFCQHTQCIGRMPVGQHAEVTGTVLSKDD